jgi:hypothetical protein
LNTGEASSFKTFERGSFPSLYRGLSPRRHSQPAQPLRFCCTCDHWSLREQPQLSFPMQTAATIHTGPACIVAAVCMADRTGKCHWQSFSGVLNSAVVFGQCCVEYRHTVHQKTSRTVYFEHDLFDQSEQCTYLRIHAARVAGPTETAALTVAICYA